MDHALLVLRPRPWKWLAILVTCALFVWAGWHMAFHAQNGFDRVVGRGCAVFFGLGSLVAVAQLTFAPSEVVVGAGGLYIRTLFKRVFLPWEDIDRFGVSEWTQWHGPFRQRHRQVGIVFRAERRKSTSGLGLLARQLAGYDGALPDNYGYEHQELADLLNGYVENHRNRQDR